MVDPGAKAPGLLPLNGTAEAVPSQGIAGSSGVDGCVGGSIEEEEAGRMPALPVSESSDGGGVAGTIEERSLAALGMTGALGARVEDDDVTA